MPVAAAVSLELRVPPLIRRNTMYLAAAEAFIGTGQQMVPSLGSIMVVHFLGSATFAGISNTILSVCRLLIAYPAGRLADARGRKPVLVAGLLSALVGTLGMGISVLLASFPLYLLALVAYGLGSGVSADQRRLSAADMYPPTLRGRGIGWVLSGSVVGALGGPVVIASAVALSVRLGPDPLALAWLLVPLLIIPGIVLVQLIHPDPKTIATNLTTYFPTYVPPPATSGEVVAAKQVTIWTFLRNYPQLTGSVSMCILAANMTMMMVTMPLMMQSESFALTAISLTIGIHVVGMYGFSMPLGRLCDRIGRRLVLLAGVLLSTAGTVLSVLTADEAVIIVGLFLVGVGWSAGNVASAALIADTARPELRGRAMGTLSTMNSAGSGLAAMLSGLLMAAFGVTSTVVVSVIILLPALILLLRLHEPKPGQYLVT